MSLPERSLCPGRPPGHRRHHAYTIAIQTRKLEAQAGNGECSGSGPHVEVTSQSLRFFICKDGAAGFPGLL